MTKTFNNVAKSIILVLLETYKMMTRKESVLSFFSVNFFKITFLYPCFFGEMVVSFSFMVLIKIKRPN